MLEFDFSAAEKLPPQIIFGTSSWIYPGWKGLVYHRAYQDEKQFKAECLSEYVKFPWFRTVGIDHTFYAPARKEVLEQYHELLPPNFSWASKVWEEITIPKYPSHPRYGKKAGLSNIDFLNPQKFEDRVLSPFIESNTVNRCGPFILQFQMFDKELLSNRELFFAKLENFLADTPKGLIYAMEVRNKELLVPQYFELLNRYQATHCFNHWTWMPPLRNQMTIAANCGGLSAPFFVARILTPLGLKYEAAVKTFTPYNEIKQPSEKMRDDLVTLAKRAIKRNIPAYILVNNRSEGCAPQTIDALGRMIVNVNRSPGACDTGS